MASSSSNLKANSVSGFWSLFVAVFAFGLSAWTFVVHEWPTIKRGDPKLSWWEFTPSAPLGQFVEHARFRVTFENEGEIAAKKFGYGVKYLFIDEGVGQTTLLCKKTFSGENLTHGDSTAIDSGNDLPSPKDAQLGRLVHEPQTHLVVDGQYTYDGVFPFLDRPVVPFCYTFRPAVEGNMEACDDRVAKLAKDTNFSQKTATDAPPGCKELK